jgi:hypothetical protein
LYSGDRDLIDVVLKSFKLVDVRGWKEIWPRREDLSELDISRSEFDEAFAEGPGPLRRSTMVLARFRLVRQPLEALLPRKIGEAVPRKQADGGGQSREVARREDH